MRRTRCWRRCGRAGRPEREIGDANYGADADIDRSGEVDVDDLNVILSGWGSSAAPIDQVSTVGCSIGYGGASWDHAVKLYNMRNRWYSPEQGRWLTRDPAGYVDGMSLYLYVMGNPLAYFDPWGLEAWYKRVQYAVVDFGAAVGDTISFGGTKALRNALGLEYNVNTHSDGYTAGEVTATTVELATGVAGLAKGGAKIVGKKVLGEAVEGGTEQAVRQATKEVVEEASDQLGTRVAGGVDDAAERLRKNVEIGKQGEDAAGITAPKKAIKVDGKNYFPDELNRSAMTLTEVKNVQELSFTKQLRAYSEYAVKEGYEFILKVREGTKLSGPLQDAIKEGQIILRRCLR